MVLYVLLFTRGTHITTRAGMVIYILLFTRGTQRISRAGMVIYVLLVTRGTHIITRAGMVIYILLFTRGTGESCRTRSPAAADPGLCSELRGEAGIYPENHGHGGIRPTDDHESHPRGEYLLYVVYVSSWCVLYG